MLRYKTKQKDKAGRLCYANIEGVKRVIVFRAQKPAIKFFA